MVDAANISLQWTAPTTNADGTTCDDLAGYKIHYGTTSGTYIEVIDVGNVTAYTVESLADGTYYFAATAYDTSGNVSDYSNEVSEEIAVSPSSPVDLLIVTIQEGKIIDTEILRLSQASNDGSTTIIINQDGQFTQ